MAMSNLRTSHMDSQRYDFSNRRQPSCLTIFNNNATVHYSSTPSAHEASFQSPQYPEEPWEEHRTNIPSARTSHSDDTPETRSPSRVSLVESCTSTLSGDLSLNSPKKDQRAPEVKPSLRKSKSSIGRILCGLDCTRSTTYMLGDDLEGNEEEEKTDSQETIIPTQHDVNKIPIPRRNLRASNPPLFKPGKETCYTDTFVHEDGCTTTCTIIRPRSRSRSSRSQGGLGRMRSLDCLRGSNTFEDELDSVWLTQSQKSHGQQQQQQVLRLQVYEEHTVIAEERWRSAVQSMLYQNTQPVHSIKSHVEVN